MNEEAPAETAPPRRRLRLGCLGWLALAIVVAVGLVVAIGETFDQGNRANAPESKLNAGPADQYARSDVTLFETRHLFVVRLEDGSFLALYDKSSKEQEQTGDCRVRYDESAQLIGLPQLPGFRGAFVSECNDLRATWRADGAFAGGADYGDLDRFNTSIDDAGDLVVDTSSRSCTRSRGVVGLPPYDARVCEGAG